jgi:quinol monooxygenase YgiN
MNAVSEPVTVVITCTVKPGMQEMAKRELEASIETVIARESACRGIRLHEDPKNPLRLMIIERWDSEEAFTGPHMQTDHMKTFLKKAETFVDGTAAFAFWREVLAAP